MRELQEQSLEICLSTGITIEANLWKPRAFEHTEGGGNKLAICLHPWSWLGGRKEDPVLMSLIEPIVDRKNYHALSYNSRGTGKSTGRSSFSGLKEVDDLKAVIDWSVKNIKDLRSIVILGYSHGSLIASMHPLLPALKISHILLSYPLGPRAWLTMFHSSTYDSALHELVRQTDSNVLIIYGDRDDFTSVEKYRAWTSTLAVPNVKVHEIRNASHFWHGQGGHEMVDIISQWLP